MPVSLPQSACAALSSLYLVVGVSWNSSLSSLSCSCSSLSLSSSIMGPALACPPAGHITLQHKMTSTLQKTKQLLTCSLSSLILVINLQTKLDEIYPLIVCSGLGGPEAFSVWCVGSRRSHSPQLESQVDMIFLLFFFELYFSWDISPVTFLL